jgi:hypothetical protein
MGIAEPERATRAKLRVAFGPEAPGWGSWDWTGADVQRSLNTFFNATTFRPWELPDCDVLVVVKHAPPRDWVEEAARRAAVVYGPVDFYGCANEIDADAPWLRRCACVLVHCERLRRYFQPYARVEYMDHAIKFAAPLRESFQAEGNLLWVGVHSNLPPLIDWVNTHTLAAPLDVLTNLESGESMSDPAALGFRPRTPVRIHSWTPERQVAMTARARAAVDIKGADFRARHKPPAKGIDFIASGIPLAMNTESSTVEHLARLGFDIASPLDPDRWLSRAYWDETRRFGAEIRELLTPERIARRYARILESVIAPGPQSTAV